MVGDWCSSHRVSHQCISSSICACRDSTVFRDSGLRHLLLLLPLLLLRQGDLMYLIEARMDPLFFVRFWAKLQVIVEVLDRSVSLKLESAT
jgi:aromatic ring-opening dioxygenase LigB subunit